MTIFYVSVRPITFDGKRNVSPKYMLNNGFKGMTVNWKCVVPGANDDGRWMYEIETDTLEHQEVVVEGLQMWGAHLKTLESAKLLAEKLTGRVDITIEFGKLVFPNVKDEI